MGIRERILAWARMNGEAPATPPSRRERREAARDRARATGGDPWPEDARLDRPLDNVHGEDVTPGTPGGRTGPR